MARSSSIDIAVAMMGLYGGAPYLIGGSYVVDPKAANDVDIIIHEYTHVYGKHVLPASFRELREGDEKYDEIDNVRIITIYEGMIGQDKCNIIVVGAAFWPAYMGAINEMRNNPEMYRSREDRIHLHRSLSRQVADIAGIDIPEAAL